MADVNLVIEDGIPGGNNANYIKDNAGASPQNISALAIGQNRIGVGITSLDSKLEVKGDNATAPGSGIATASALKVLDGDSAEMFAVSDGIDSHSNNFTIMTSLSGEIMFIPKEKSSAGIQAVVDYLTNEGKPGTIFLPTGDYYLTSSINIGEGFVGSPVGSPPVEKKTGSGIRIIGAGQRATILYINSTTSPTRAISAISINGGQRSDGSFLSSEQIEIKDLAISTMDGGGDKIHTAIENKGGCGILIENVAIGVGSLLWFADGIKSLCWNAVIHNCMVWHCWYHSIYLTSTQIGSQGFAAHATRILYCSIGMDDYDSDDPGVDIYGIRSECNASSEITGCTFNGGTHKNHVWDTHKIIFISIGANTQGPAVGMVVMNNYCEGADVQIELQCTGNTVMGNFLGGTNREYLSIDPANAAGNVAINNYIYELTNTQPTIFNSEIYDPTVLGSESLNDGNFINNSPSKWTAWGDFDVSSGAAIYTHGTYGCGGLRQYVNNMTIPGVGNRWYKLEYTVSESVGSCGAMIAAPFADVIRNLSTTNGTHVCYFKSASNPGYFSIYAQSSPSSPPASFKLEKLSLKEIQGGDAVLHGKITGGGSSGIKVLSNGNIGVCTEIAEETTTISNTAFERVYYYDGQDQTYYDYTSEAKSSGGTAYTVLENTSDYFYVGSESKFSKIFFDIAQAAAAGGVTLLVEYYRDGGDVTGWQAVTEEENDLEDSTDNLQHDGTISFATPCYWEKTTHDSPDALPELPELYWVRLSTKNSPPPSSAVTAYLTVPTDNNRLGVYAQAGDTTPALLVKKDGNIEIGADLKLKVDHIASSTTDHMIIHDHQMRCTPSGATYGATFGNDLGSAYVAYNNYVKPGTAWYNDNTAGASAMLYVTTNGYDFYTRAAGAAEGVGTVKMALSNAGNLSLNGGKLTADHIGEYGSNHGVVCDNILKVDEIDEASAGIGFGGAFSYSASSGFIKAASVGSSLSGIAAGSGSGGHLVIYLLSYHGTGCYLDAFDYDTSTAQDIIICNNGGKTKVVGAFGCNNVTPAAAQAHVADPTDLATCISAITSILATLETFGFHATS